MTGSYWEDKGKSNSLEFEKAYEMIVGKPYTLKNVYGVIVKLRRHFKNGYEYNAEVWD